MSDSEREITEEEELELARLELMDMKVTETPRVNGKLIECEVPGICELELVIKEVPKKKKEELKQVTKPKKAKIKVTCTCGSKLNKTSLRRHYLSKKHVKYENDKSEA